MNMNVPAPAPGIKRVVIIGGGIAGISLTRKLVKNKQFQIVLIDKHNYNQFPPLLYQVATSGLEPTAISFPLRKIFRKKKNFFFRMAKLQSVMSDQNKIRTSIGDLEYDYLVLAAGTDTNYFGNEDIIRHTMPLKSVPEALAIRNRILKVMEGVVRMEDSAEKTPYLNFVIVGGGPTGVELAGALAELKRKIFPKDYPDMDIRSMKIYLINGAPRLLESFSEESSARAYKDLEEAGVDIILGAHVTDYDGLQVSCDNGMILESRTVIWTSGVIANPVEGLDASQIGHARRILVDGINRIEGLENVFAIGDQSLLLSDPKYPKGHPQLAQVAIQQGRLLAKNLKQLERNEPTQCFAYRDKGTMATIGRNQAVAEIGNRKFGGFLAWVMWLFVHLFYIVGAKNRVTVLIDWFWGYITYDRPLRTIIESERKNVPVTEEKK